MLESAAAEGKPGNVGATVAAVRELTDANWSITTGQERVTGHPQASRARRSVRADVPGILV